MRIFNIKNIKNSPGINLPVMLPRQSGKTTHIIKSMQPRDVCISPNIHGINCFNNLFFDKVIKHDIQQSITNDNLWYIIERDKNFNMTVQFLRGHSINTLFIDEFLYYEEDSLVKFLNEMKPACYNIIMMGSSHLCNYNSGFTKSFSVYYDKIGDPNKFNLPDELFVL